MARVCVVGSVNHDLSLRVAELPRPGATVLAGALAAAPGGKGGNQAVAAARAGADVQLVAAVGDDEPGRTLISHLRAAGVGVDAVATVDEASGTAVILTDDQAENAIVVAPGANSLVRADTPAAGRAIAGADVVLIQLEIPVAVALAAARAGRAAGALVLLNASPVVTVTTEVTELAESVDVVICNADEDERWPWAAAHRVVTLGAAGARHHGPDGTHRVSAPRVEPVDTAGAGDVFAGVLAAAWPTRSDAAGTESADIETALRRACAAGALATLIPGAGDCAPDSAAVDELLRS